MDIRKQEDGIGEIIRHLVRSEYSRSDSQYRGLIKTNKKKPAHIERADYSANKTQNYFFSSGAGAASAAAGAASDLPPPGTDAVAMVGLSLE